VSTAGQASRKVPVSACYVRGMAKEQPNQAQFVAAMMETFMEKARQIAEDDQHAPICVLLSDQAVIPINAPFTDDEAKVRFVRVVQSVSKKMNAYAAVFITEAWVTVLPAAGDGGALSDEDAYEALQQYKASGGKRKEVLLLTVEQRGKRPMVLSAEVGAENGTGERKIGPWEPIMDGDGIFSGQMMDLLGELQDVRVQA